MFEPRFDDHARADFYAYRAMVLFGCCDSYNMEPLSKAKEAVLRDIYDERISTKTRDWIASELAQLVADQYVEEHKYALS